MKTVLLAAIAALALSGCVTAEEMAAQRAEFKAQVATADDSDCRSYGAEQGTPVYVQCRMVKDQQRIQQTAAAQAAANEQFNHGLCLIATGAYPGRPVNC